MDAELSATELGAATSGLLLGRAIVAVGVDLADVERIRRAARRRAGFVSRVFTEAEAAYATAAVDPGQRLAARFAAKEATMKALGVGLGAVRLGDIEVVRDPRGAPSLHLHGAAASRAAEIGIDGWLISLSHTNAVAVAVVAGWRGGGEDGAVMAGLDL